MTRAQQRYRLALILVIAGIVLLGALFVVPIPTANERLVDIAIGLVLGWGGAAVQFYFGTSDGSVAKSEQIDRMVKGDSE
jgi:uncharacterized membrane protein YccC